MTTFDYACMIIGSALKWPMAVQVFEAACRDNIVAAAHEAAMLASAAMKATEACDGMVMEDVRQEPSKTGRAARVTGLLWGLQKRHGLGPGRGEGGGG